MLTKLISENNYDGMFCRTTMLNQPEEVEIVGVLFPVDPGMVAITRNGNLVEVPTFALENEPKIDFGAMLTEEQKAERERFGGLIGAGLCVRNRTLLPIEQCKFE